MKKTVWFAASIALMVLVFAVAVFAYDGLSTGNVTDVRYQSSRTLVIQSGASNPGGCNSASYLYLAEDGSAFAKRANASISIAIVTGRETTFALTGCSDGGTTGFPIITEVWLKD